MVIDREEIHDDHMEINYPIKLAENLNRLMNKRRMTISQTASAVGMNKSTLHNYLNGVVPRNIVTLKKLADLFDLTLSELMFGPEYARESVVRGIILEGVYELVIRRTKDVPPRTRP